jgi:hypothetical protein
MVVLELWLVVKAMELDPGKILVLALGVLSEQDVVLAPWWKLLSAALLAQMY